jgi:hypothetical protein
MTEACLASGRSASISGYRFQPGALRWRSARSAPPSGWVPSIGLHGSLAGAPLADSADRADFRTLQRLFTPVLETLCS